MEIIRATNFYTRRDVELDENNLYIFTDNCDRSSGWNPIPDGWYTRKYGKGLRFPNKTTAILRGLYNAYPITTQHHYNSQYRGDNGRWTDDDFEEFKRVIDDDFNEIKNNCYKFDKIIFPVGGIFNRKISCISKERTPKLYEYLMNKCKEMYKYF